MQWYERGKTNVGCTVGCPLHEGQRESGALLTQCRKVLRKSSIHNGAGRALDGGSEGEVSPLPPPLEGCEDFVERAGDDRPGGTSVKTAWFFYEIGRKRSGIIHGTLLAEGCAFIEMQRLSLIVLC